MTGPREAAELEGKDEGHRIETESSKHRFRCELNFNENEDAEWQSDDAAVIGETMVTEHGRILSVINKNAASQESGPRSSNSSQYVQGTIESGEETCKCRLVVRGDRAQAGLHYPEGMECLGSAMSSLKLMCARSVHSRSLMRSFDIAIVYTQSKAPEGYNNRIKTPPGSPKITNAEGDEICYKLISNL